MPTTLHTVAEDNISVRYEAPLLSRDINQKIVAAMPHGIYRGFRLGTSASVLTVDVEVDPDHGDSMAVVETLDGFGISAKIAGVVPLDLSTYTTKTVVIAIFGEYAVGSDTTAVIRAYELSPTDEFTGASEHDELVVLGTVVVPASGLIPIANISPRYRTSSWDFEAPERVQWLPLLADPMFVSAEDGSQPESTRYWRATDTAGSGYWEIQSYPTVPPVFGAYSMFLHIGTGPYSTFIYQDVDVPVAAGQYYYVRLYFQEDGGITGGTLGVKLTFDDEFMASTTVVSHTIDFTALSAGWNRIDFAGQVPSSGVRWLRRIQIDASALTGSDVGWFDAAQVFLEAKPANLALNANTRLDRVVADRILMVLGNLASSNLTGSQGLALENNAGVLELLAQTSGLKNKTFATGQLVLGEDLQTAASQAELPRVKADANTNTNYTLLWETEFDAFTPIMRLYVDDQGAFTVTHNARWESTGSLWYADPAGSGLPSQLYTFGQEALYCFRKDAGGGSWSTGGWDDNKVLYQGIIEEFGNAYVSDVTQAKTPRISGAYRVSAYTCLWEAKYGTTNPAFRLYTNDGAFVFTYNAEWTGSVWDYDSSTTDSRMVWIGENGISVNVKEQPHSTTWGNAAWDEQSIPFRGIIETLGAEVLSNSTDAAKPRINMNHWGGTYTLLLASEWGTPGLNAKVRLYLYNGKFVITTNALWDPGGPEWLADDIAGDDAYKYEFGDTGLKAYKKEAPPAAWADSAWDDPAFLRIDSQLELGGDMTGTDVEAGLARIRMRVRTNYTLLLETTISSTAAQLRLYKDANTHGLVVTYNAVWDGTDWNADNTGNGAQKYVFGELGLDTYFKYAGTASWLDSAWDGQALDWAGQAAVNLRGLIDIGDDLLDTSTEARQPRINTDMGSTPYMTCILESLGSNPATTGAFRIYRDEGTSTPDVWLTLNAEWTGSAWDEDTTTPDALALRFDGADMSIKVYAHNPTGATWTTWGIANGIGTRLEPNSVGLGDKTTGLYFWTATKNNANLQAGDTPGPNNFTAKTFAKAWGHVVCTGGGSTLDFGLNYTASITGGGDLLITLNRALIAETNTGGGGATNGVGCIVTQVYKNGATGWYASESVARGTSNNTFQFAIYNNSNVYQNLNSIAADVSFVVFGSMGASA